MLPPGPPSTQTLRVHCKNTDLYTPALVFSNFVVYSILFRLVFLSHNLWLTTVRTVWIQSFQTRLCCHVDVDVNVSSERMVQSVSLEISCFKLDRIYKSIFQIDLCTVWKVQIVGVWGLIGCLQEILQKLMLAACHGARAGNWSLLSWVKLKENTNGLKASESKLNNSWLRGAGPQALGNVTICCQSICAF